jgi:hypothetical protein
MASLAAIPTLSATAWAGSEADGGARGGNISPTVPRNLSITAAARSRLGIAGTLLTPPVGEPRQALSEPIEILREYQWQSGVTGRGSFGVTLLQRLQRGLHREERLKTMSGGVGDRRPQCQPDGVGVRGTMINSGRIS